MLREVVYKVLVVLLWLILAFSLLGVVTGAFGPGSPGEMTEFIRLRDHIDTAASCVCLTLAAAALALICRPTAPP